MSKLHHIRKQALEKEKQNTNFNLFSKNLKKNHPLGLPRACSTLSLSSLSLSLSQNSTDSSLTDNSTSLDQKISFALRLIAPVRKKEALGSKIVEINSGEEGLRRCNWITKNSGN
ncbi:DNA glycosylase superfamily protein [Striga hermonthica]|uniref:DNA glycosylase superfamily protein n=1 Tax=Striga hermonthica TaxID=68872 RepID=A0A9N7NHC7_STRHE|nr:DNA glycosylase superfamily protein [Striga hermonthica]